MRKLSYQWEELGLSIIVRQDDVRRQNQFGVLMALRRHGFQSRTDLSAVTGLSASTVTVITNSLLDRGALVAEAIGEFAGPRRGRPQVRLSPNPMHASVAVIFLGLNAIQIELADYAGMVVGSMVQKTPTHELSGDELADVLISALNSLLERHGADLGPLGRIAVGVEGIVDADGQTLLSSPVTGTCDVPIGRMLERAFGASVEIANESNMVAEALRWKAPERYGTDFATVLLSVGVGMGLYLNGSLFSGIRSSAVEFGHMCYQPDGALCRCGRRGCIEAYAGMHSIWRMATGADELAVLQEEPPENALELLMSRARASDGPERRAFREAGKAIGTGLSNLFTMLDAIPLVFTGPGVAALDLMMESIKDALARPCFGLPVSVSVIDSYLDYRALIREGALMRALVFLDQTMPGMGEFRERAALDEGQTKKARQ
jgi:predicted NBD/HSP70 family sugar kinase